MTDEIPEPPAVIVEGGPIDGHSMPLSPGMSLIIGSGRLAHLRLDHPAIELAHVKVTWDDQGIAMIDNGSRHGTWVNGEKVETTALLDGDVISMSPPDVQPPAPRVRIRIPKGSVPEPPPLPPGAEAALPGAARRGGRRPTRVGRRRRGLDLSLPDISLPSPRVMGVVGAAAAVVVLAVWVVSRLFGPGPSLSSVTPPRCEAGASVTLAGRGFASSAADNTVWFGERSVPAETVGGGTLHVTVPRGIAPGSVPIRVETARGRSGAVTLTILSDLEATAVEPEGALPGDTVTLRGRGFDAGPATINVDGAGSTVIDAAPDAIRFQMPAVGGAPGSLHTVVATVAGRSTKPLELALGRVPLVLSFEPPRARAGDLVRVRGIGFPDEPAGVGVTFDGVPALVAASSSHEMAVVAPLLTRAEAETSAEVLVRMGDRVSAEGVRYPLVRLTAGTYALRFFAAAGMGSGTATVASEIAPVMLLGGREGAISVAQRAMSVARTLNETLERPRGSEPIVFEARPQPEAGVALAGGPTLLVSATAGDAAAYAATPGVPSRGGPPTLDALAEWWAALLNDYVTVCTGPERPTAVAAIAPAAGSAMIELRGALPFRYRAGVANEQVVELPAHLRARLEEAALRVP
jgi:FHA domain/IPT/TIG domain